MGKATIRKAEWKDLAGRIFEGVKHADLFRSCINCVGFDEPSEICKRYKQRPPARIIANGCDNYDDTNDIPF
jgi:hypothetical protein